MLFSKGQKNRQASGGRKRIAAVEEYIKQHYMEEGIVCGSCCEPVYRYVPSKRSLDDLMNNLDETFSQMLLRKIDERGQKDSAVYKKEGQYRPQTFFQNKK